MKYKYVKEYSLETKDIYYFRVHPVGSYEEFRHKKWRAVGVKKMFKWSSNPDDNYSNKQQVFETEDDLLNDMLLEMI